MYDSNRRYSELQRREESSLLGHARRVLAVREEAAPVARLSSIKTSQTNTPNISSKMIPVSLWMNQAPS